MAKPLALTLGEPAGIGPDITIKAWLRRNELKLPPFYLLGDGGFIALCIAAMLICRALLQSLRLWGLTREFPSIDDLSLVAINQGGRDVWRLAPDSLDAHGNPHHAVGDPNRPPSLFPQRRIQVQHERVSIATELGNNERHPLSH